MYSHISRSETKTLLGSRRYCLSAKIHLTPQETHLAERYRLNRVEIFYDPVRDDHHADATSAHARAKARGLFVTKARDASAICAAEVHALVSTIRALLAFNITLDDLVRG